MATPGSRAAGGAPFASDANHQSMSLSYPQWGQVKFRARYCRFVMPGSPTTEGMITCSPRPMVSTVCPSTPQVWKAHAQTSAPNDRLFPESLSQTRKKLTDVLPHLAHGRFPISRECGDECLLPKQIGFIRTIPADSDRCVPPSDRPPVRCRGCLPTFDAQVAFTYTFTLTVWDQDGQVACQAEQKMVTVLACE